MRREGRYNYLVRYLITTIIYFACQVPGHCELGSVKESVFIPIRQLPDLVQGGVRQLRYLLQEPPHLLLGQPASLGLQLVKPCVVPPLILRCKVEFNESNAFS